MTFQKKSRRERYIVRDDVSEDYKKDIFSILADGVELSRFCWPANIKYLIF